MADDDDGDDPKRPKTADEILRQKRDFEKKCKDEALAKEIAARYVQITADHGEKIENDVRKHGYLGKEDSKIVAEQIIKDMATNNTHINGIRPKNIEYYVQKFHDAEEERENALDALAQNKEDQNSKTGETKTAEQPTPEGKKAEDALNAERLAQRAQMNKADMERLAKSGPKRSNYEPLRHDEVQQRFGNPEAIAKYDRDDRNRTDAQKSSSLSPQTGSGAADTKKRGNGLMDDFVTTKTKKEDAEQTIQQQWKAAGKGMTRR